MLQKIHLPPVVDTTDLAGVDANDGTLDNTTASPESNYILPDRSTEVSRRHRIPRAKLHGSQSHQRHHLNELGGGNNDNFYTEYSLRWCGAN
jgi:hypothetical protein